MASKITPVPSNTILLVVHDFVARSSDEISLHKGDRVELIERDDDFGDGWYLGKHMANGKTGLFPQVYTTPAPNPVVGASTTRQLPVAITRQSSSPNRSASTPHATAMPASTTHIRSTSQASLDLDHESNTRNLPSLHTTGFDNPVMNETLSVIDEHITDMRIPKMNGIASATTAEAQPRPSKPPGSKNPYETEYRVSYINGHETDEEESRLLTKAEVSRWSPNRVAEYLEDAGVDPQHCDVFRDQEISGEVLLAMEQSAIFIKEFELGSVGRRLKTWHKIKALQEEVKAATAPSIARSVSDYSANAEEPVPEISNPKTRASTAAQIPSTYLSPTDYTSEMRTRQGFPDRTAASSISLVAPMNRTPDERFHRPDSTIRPSAASIRQLNHTRRQSSLDSKMSNQDDPQSAQSAPANTHSRKISLDRLWSMAGSHDNSSARRLSKSAGAGGPSHSHTASGGSLSNDNSPRLESSPADESQPEHTKRSLGRFLPKRTSNSVPHSRTASDSTNEPNSVATGSSAIISPNNTSHSSMLEAGKSRAIRNISQPKIVPINTHDGSGSPIVTKLEYGPPSPALPNAEANPNSHSPSSTSHGFHLFHKNKPSALRSASDAAALDKKAPINGSPLQSPARTGSTTPSTESKSIEQPKSENRDSTGSSQNAAAAVANDASANRSRPVTRSKKLTSAYTRGLEKKSPVEQMADCDYSGWMKKRSANIMGTWKPRLFVLRGRRLSYYYTENDTEEKGLIDISGHRVLPADDERITGLHAQITGAKSPVTSELSPKVATAAAADLAATTPTSDANKEEGLFIFKLVPPREGMSKAVNFTKPAVHYFAVSSRQEGRLWMAALMKATIDYDHSGTVTTSYNQETISLAKARARRELPPALRDIDGSNANYKISPGPHGQQTPPSLPDPPSGLGIDGLTNGHAHNDGSTSAGGEDSSVNDQRSMTDNKVSIESEHRAFDFQDFGESVRKIIPAT